jgi:hypothetical protein
VGFSLSTSAITTPTSRRGLAKDRGKIISRVFEVGGKKHLKLLLL